MANHLAYSITQRFERLLCGLNGWQTVDGREALLGVLRDFELWDDLNRSGAPREVATRLLGLFEKHGPEPFCALLSSLRTQNHGAPRHLAEIAALDREFQSLRARRHREPWKGAPYRGLAYFDRKHAPIFFGRDAEVQSLIRLLTSTDQGRRFTVVVGASGSGKSSLVRAGLWARLAAGQVPELPGSARWLITAMTPLEIKNPTASLHAALVQALKDHDGYEDKVSRAAGVESGSLAELAEQLLPPPGTAGGTDARWLLILDQMEELFGGPEIAAEGAAFLDRILESTQPHTDGTPSRFQVVATLRADFFHHCLTHPPLKRAVSREGGQFLLSAPGRLDLERMVSGPIEEVDLAEPCTLDAALPPTIAADAERQAGGLALLAFGLRELYDLCENRTLNVDAYRSAAFGGLSGAIARRADATLAALGQDGEAALWRVFARLVRVSQDDAPTRLRERRSAWNKDPAASGLLDAFIKARLLVADGTTDPVVEVAHEALLREWPKLAAWIDLRREAFRLADRVRTEAQAWMGGDPRWHNRRPWAADICEDARSRLAQAGLLDQLLGDPAVARLLTPEVEWLLAEIQDSAANHIRRRDIGQRLAEIGDPRPGVGVKADGFPDIVWRPIPAGSIDVEKLGSQLVKPFQMAAFPVTFGQFRAFLDAKDGYSSKRWWKDLKHEEPDAAWQSHLANHPVTDVSWYDATAFCRWLTARTGREVRLPFEWEWQWAAQSARSGFLYPWGPDWKDGVANTSESEIRRTTAVGMYPQGRSEQEVWDLAGNVWEWCSNEFETGEEPRVLRGGSWSYYLGGARADCRNLSHPYDRDVYVGFRLVSSSPIR